MKNVTIRKGAALAQVIASSALAALVSNIDLIPAGKYQLLAVLSAGALQAVLPSPIAKTPQASVE